MSKSTFTHTGAILFTFLACAIAIVVMLVVSYCSSNPEPYALPFVKYMTGAVK